MNVTYCYLAGRRSHLLIIQQAPPENPPTPLPNVYFYILSSLYRASLPYFLQGCDYQHLGFSPSFPIFVELVPAVSFASGSLSSPTTSTTTASYRIASLGKHICSAVYHLPGRNEFYLYQVQAIVAQFHDLFHCLVSTLRPRMRHGRWMTNGSPRSALATPTTPKGVFESCLWKQTSTRPPY